LTARGSNQCTGSVLFSNRRSRERKRERERERREREKKWGMGEILLGEIENIARQKGNLTS
jgi:hypothetical protein